MAALFVLMQYLLPRYWLTAVIYRLARIRQPRVKNFLIERFADLYDVNLDEVLLEVPNDFATFNEFFTRELATGERPIDDDDDILISPVDGTVSVAGPILADSIIQAKGIDYTLSDLLATDLDNAAAFEDGNFATIYLAPYNYHRVHCPLDGELTAATYVPGDLFSVNAATVARVRGLFRRNERLILNISTSRGPAAVILVGALNVGSISTPWSGEIRPRKTGIVESISLSGASTKLQKGDLLGWFNMGSTVILLLPKGACDWDDDLAPGEIVRMGEAIARLSDGDE